ncbi:MAG TPA: tetratricopeptide repeat protein [Candidatus Kapabacteria bacterium]|nr:tetratricopeptide repeat protein [Candidatus Kapabacteria bacterium]
MTRLEKLQELLKSDPADSFTRYAIGLEYRGMKDYPAAIKVLEDLRREDPHYLATYYQLADCYRETGDNNNAIECYKQGISVARAANDTHTMSELQAAMDDLEDGM